MVKAKELLARIRSWILENTAEYDSTLLGGCGKDVYISRYSVIRRPQLVTVGDHVAIDPWFHCTTSLKIGNHVHISSHVSIIGGARGRLELGHFTNISTGGRIICGSDEFLGYGFIAAPGIPEEYRDRLKLAPVVFEDFVNTGANVIVLPGVRLGEGSVIGANSLVLHDTDPWTVYAGSPARKIKPRSRERILAFAHKMGYR